MRTFFCDTCGGLVFFENVQCVRCGRALGFLPDVLDLSTLEPEGPDRWCALSAPANHQIYRQCQNGHEHYICNWFIPDDDDSNSFCQACRLNDTVPNPTIPQNLERWHKMELAKRRLLYTLLRLGLPLTESAEDNIPALRFNFLADAPGGAPVMTGHANGLITLNIAEADEAEREKRRINLHEPYRTLLGHFRHESGHYFWDRLIAKTSERLTRFREFFGDETKNYSAAIKSYYQQGPPPDWQAFYVSAYSSAHPWEDWAETWAHYLHIVDAIETAAGFGLTLSPNHPAAQTMSADLQNSEENESFDRILNNWIPLTYALNSLNRGMGLPDLYPFVLSSTIIAKLRFIHETIQDVRAAPTAEQQPEWK
jgi:hypothetical protein